MKNRILILILLLPILFFGQVTTSPSPIEIDQSVTITMDATSTATDCNGFTTNPSKVYMHAGIGDDDNAWDFDVIGNWGQDDGIGEMTDNGDDTWSITFTPNSYFNLTSAEESSATKMGMVFRNADGTKEFKKSGCVDFIFNVGSFQVTMINPNTNETKYVDTGGSLTVMAQNTNGAADYELFANGTSITTENTTFLNFNHTNITENISYELVVTQSSSSVSKFFNVVINPGTISATIPVGLEEGINYNSTDATKAILVLNAPLKDFVYVVGSFNNWQPTVADAMKTDPTTGKYWLELTDLTAGQIETFQYWVFETTPITNSPKLVKTADPYSTLVLSPFDDPWIPTTSYPNMPNYPTGQEREVSVLQTGQSAYNWQVADFNKPKKEDLVIYEVLLRDFDENRNFQDLIDKIDYFKDLNINAIELMPVMEYEGNEGWGYNPSFHLALDKFYGTKDKFKELIDLCHQNGIAVILDVVLNHAMGRNAANRMWMIDDDNDGWGLPSSENPYFNVTSTHSYGIGNDFNHSSPITKYYTKRVIKHWIEEFHIDGFRWDLTKGFTQNCTGNDGCTNSYQQDRVDVLREYADYSWSIDPTHYTIFEHLGNDNEEQQWANYRAGEGKGVMMWGKMTEQYGQVAMGYSTNSNFNRMGHESHGFTHKRVIGYAESHDEERIMYSAKTYGNGDIQNENIALSRMPALGAISLTIPGPKMIWHFGELGMDNSLNMCTDGTVDNDCRLETKPQPQWTENWMGTTNRKAIYDAWSRINYLKINEDVFEGSYSINSGDLTPKIYIWDDAIPASELKNVVIISNFTNSTQNVVPNFPYIGNWYDLMDETGNTVLNVTNTTTPISLPAGGFKMYGNQSNTLSNTQIKLDNLVKLYPNPAKETFKLNNDVKRVRIFDFQGKLIKEYSGELKQGYSFNIENLTTGIYLVKIETKTKKSIIKLIK